MESSVVESVNTICSCDFVGNYLVNGTFECFKHSVDSVTYRGLLHGFNNILSQDLIEAVEEWIEGNATISVQSVLLPVNSTCRVNVATESGELEECSTGIGESSKVLQITISVVATFIAIVFVIISIVLTFFAVKRCRRKLIQYKRVCLC